MEVSLYIWNISVVVSVAVTFGVICDVISLDEKLSVKSPLKVLPLLGKAEEKEIEVEDAVDESCVKLSVVGTMKSVVCFSSAGEVREAPSPSPISELSVAVFGDDVDVRCLVCSVVVEKLSSVDMRLLTISKYGVVCVVLRVVCGGAGVLFSVVDEESESVVEINSAIVNVAIDSSVVDTGILHSPVIWWQSNSWQLHGLLHSMPKNPSLQASVHLLKDVIFSLIFLHRNFTLFGEL